jgi:uncharacterized membrane protein YoaK (UPF0700 family)
MASVPVQAKLELIAAVFLVAVGGYGDAASFLLVGSFTGHVTGNIVLAAIAWTAGGNHIWQPLLAVCCFLSATGFALRLHSPGDHVLGGKQFRSVLLLEIALLSLAPWFMMRRHPAMLIAAMCLSLGLQNGALSQADGIGLHTTYLSGTLTRFVRSLVRPGDASGASKERKFIPIAACSFVAGALCGSFTIVHFGPSGLWGMPVLLLAVLGLSFLSPAVEL